MWIFWGQRLVLNLIDLALNPIASMSLLISVLALRCRSREDTGRTRCHHADYDNSDRFRIDCRAYINGHAIRVTEWRSLLHFPATITYMVPLKRMVLMNSQPRSGAALPCEYQSWIAMLCLAQKPQHFSRSRKT